MNSKLFLLIIFIIIYPKVFCQKTQLDSIQIKYVNRYVTSIVDVTCSQFDSTFSEVVKLYSLNKKRYFIDYEKIINKKYQLGKSADLDVRYKFIFYNKAPDRPIMIICMDKFYSATINGQMIKDKALLKLLKKSIISLK